MKLPRDDPKSPKRRIAGAFEVVLRVYYLEQCGHMVQERDLPSSAGLDAIVECPYCMMTQTLVRKKQWWKFWEP